MSGFMEIKQGGRIRLNLEVVAGQSWDKGVAICINSAGKLEKYAGQSTALVGPSLEKCVTAATGNPANDTSTVIAGKTGTILLSEAVVLNDNLSGYGGWTPGVSAVYAQVGGLYSYNSTSGVGIGQAIGGNPGSTGKLLFLYRPNLTVDR